MKVETRKFQKFYLVKFKVSTLTCGKMIRGHFSITNIFFKLKKGFNNLDEKILTLQKSSYKTSVYQKKYTYYVVKVKVAAYNLRGLGR